MEGVTPSSVGDCRLVMRYRIRGSRLLPGARHPLHRTTYIRLLRPVAQRHVDDHVRNTGRVALALINGGKAHEWALTEATRMHHPACPCPHGRKGPVRHLLTAPQAGGTP
jgi:hypothetical protein